MKAKKITSLCLALALALAAAPVLAAGPEVMDEWNQPVDMDGAKGGAYSGQAELKGDVAPGHGGNFAGNFGRDTGWNSNPQGPGGGSSDANFNKASDWK